MPNIVTFLAFKDSAEQAAKHYTSIFKNSKILNTVNYPDVPSAPSPGGVMVVEIELLGQKYVLMNGGNHFGKFTDGISLTVECDSQAEIDEYWEKLTAGGGEPGPCGWLKDKFGVWWQVNPRDIGRFWGEGDPARSQRCMEALMKMTKIDLAALERAAKAA
jgi:predicted 3-demethylubiquinone-9 3-methyltransferase (glyoxalase superfamily)